MEPPTKQRKINCPKIGLLDLPNEILEVILKYLKIDVIHLKAALVCKRFLEVTRLPTFWETFRVGFEYEQNRSKNEQIEDSCLKKIKQILKLYPDCQLSFITISHFGGSFWRNFPNLISLTIEDCSRETVSTTRKIDWSQKIRPNMTFLWCRIQ